MKILLIFDHNIVTEKLRKKIAGLKPTSVVLLPLTSQWRSIGDVEEICRTVDNPKVEIIESAKLIDKEVDIISQRISGWSAQVSEHNIGGKSIKEWFLLPRGEVSTWWFSLLSEKNPLKTDVFFNIAQLGAIDKIISSDTFNLCIYSIHGSNFSAAIELLCKRHAINAIRLSQFKRKITFKKQLRLYLERCTIFNCVLKALLSLAVRILRAIRVKLVIGPIRNRLEKFENSILFISYFPLVDKESAEKGKLKNMYAIALQEKLSQMKKKVIWIWLYAFMHGHSFGDALKLGAKFTKKGEINFFLDEFISPGLLIRSVCLWLRQIQILISLKKKIPERLLYENLSVPEAAILIRDLMVDSFVGQRGLLGILFFELYKGVFSHFSYSSCCIYFSEMNEWEKALNAAKQLKAPSIKSIGFQHANLSQNFFQFFHQPEEIAQTEKSISLPLPDILACCGDIPLSLMRRCGYPNLKKVEAIRHLYLSEYLNSSVSSKKENIVLIAGSIDWQETRALLSLFYEAFPEPEGFQVWLKAHPCVPFERILTELNIPADDSRYVIEHEPISKLVKVARIVFAGLSSVVVEALAAGSTVILPVFADHMFMSPLKGFEKYYLKVSSPAELKAVIEKFMKYGEKEDLSEAKNFVGQYWCLDKSLRRWEEILS